MLCSLFLVGTVPSCKTTSGDAGGGSNLFSSQIDSLPKRAEARTPAGRAALVEYARGIQLLINSGDYQSWVAHHNDFCPHGNWYFLPWHRAYLMSFENELRRVLNNPDFALPYWDCLLYTSPSPRDQRGSRMPSSA